ncbi:MAG: hypothetical protein MR288_03475 [Firmicutes bacterium]|nr:hypothetical protein [Bacillota bacterium]
MKKLGKYASLMLMVLFSSILLVACGKATIKSASIKDGTLPSSVYINDEFDTSEAVAVVKWSNDKTTYVDAKDLTFNTKDIDFSTVGEKELVVKYNDFEFTYKFEVKDRTTQDDTTKYNVMNVSSQLLTDFTNNSSAGKSNQETQFVITNSTDNVVNNIKAGDDNAFDFRMKAYGIVDDEPGLFDNNLLKTKVDVLIKNGAEFSAIGDDVYSTYIEKVNNTSIEFAQGAVGKTFKITVTITNAKKTDLTFTLVVDVVDGWNCYSARDLSLYDNTNMEDSWTRLKTAWGLANIDSSSIKSLVLQDNIYINDNVVPARNFWSESQVEAQSAEWRNKTNQPIVGSLIDSSSDEYGIYIRRLKDNEDMTIYGNYYSIDVTDQKDASGKITQKGLSRSVIDRDDHGIMTGAKKSYITMHTPLFRALGAKEVNGQRVTVDSDKAVNTANMRFMDTRFIGNGARSNDSLESGGILLAKAWNVNLDVHNTIMKDFFIGWFTEFGYNRTLPTNVDEYLNKYYPNYTLIGSETKEERLQKYIWNDGNKDLNCSHLIKDSKGYNSYSSLMYIWGTPLVTIENSDYVGCGGPAIIADHVTGDVKNGKGDYNYDSSTGEGGLASNIVMINSNVASYVTGNEAWFATFEGVVSAVDMMKVPNVAYQQAGKPYLGDIGDMKEAFNMSVLMKWGAQGFAKEAIFTRGSVSMFKDRADYTAYTTTGKLANGSDYYPYDLNGDYSASLGRYAYTQKPALTHLTQLGTAQAVAEQTKTDVASLAETARICSDKNGESLQLGGANLTSQTEINKDNKIYATNVPNFADANYLNVYLSNGFGLVMESQPGKTK